MNKSAQYLRDWRPWLAVAAPLTAYVYQSFSLAVNVDDVIVNQGISLEHVLTQGRWGAYLVEYVLQGANPAGFFAMALGSLLLTAAGILAADVLESRTPIQRGLFAALSATSIYFAFVFAFDSTRIAYPLGNALAVGGLWLVWQRRWAIGIACMAVSASLYPAGVEVAGTVVIGCALMSLVRNGVPDAARQFVVLAASVAVSLVVYLIATRLGYAALGIPLDNKLNLSIGNFETITRLFLRYSVPFLSGHQEPYIGWTIVIPLGLAFVLYLIGIGAALWHRGAATIALAAILTTLGLMSPYALALATSQNFFEPRSLYAFSMLSAVWFALAFETLSDRVSRRVARWAFAAGLLVLTGHMLESNNFAYDDALATQSDLALINRVIYRIDEVRSEAGLPSAEPIRIAVRTSGWWQTGPRGFILSSTYADWSKEWIFRYLDRRFIPTRGAERDQLLAGEESRPSWPAAGSVAIKDGAVVVALN